MRVDKTRNLPEYAKMILQTGMGAPHDYIHGIYKRIQVAAASDDAEIRKVESGQSVILDGRNAAVLWSVWRCMTRMKSSARMPR